MKEVTINGAAIQTRQQLHEQFAAALTLPAYYGHNLDALQDCLTDLLADKNAPITLTLTHTESLSAVLGCRYTTALVHMLTHTAEQCPSLTVCIFPQEGY